MSDKFNSHVDPTPNFERFIDVILSRVNRCEKHPQADEGDACHRITSDRPSVVRFAVCNWRARQAGFVGVNNAPKRH